MKIKDPKQLWKTALAQIEIKLDAPAQFKTFFQETKLLEIDGKRAVIGVPNPYTSDWLKIRHEGLIKETISYIYGEPLTPIFQIHQEEIIIDSPKQLESAKKFSEESPLFSTENGLMGSVIETIQKSGLNLKYSMSNYVVGNSNRIAHAAAMAVLNNPGTTYNPLFIHGKTGVGKTHLAQAIGRSILERNIRKKVLYTTSENFLNEMIKGIKGGTMDKFKAKYRNVDVLMIDDMQLISKWITTQEEFFNTFNEMHNAGRQIIMIADRRPEDIKNLESRLRTRMQGGMVVDIENPDFEMRLAIVQRKAEASAIELNNKTIEFIAKSINDNVRELEGALQKVALFNQMKPDGDLTLEEVAHMLGIDSKSKQKQVKVPRVLKEVAKSFGVLVKDIKGDRRTKDVALARQVAMYILREELNYKLEQVASYVNRQDHTTVIHAIDKVKSKMMIQEDFNTEVSRIITAIQDGANVTEDIE